jgi:peptidoglycan/xylan/chitin deacetylase (PgdA/CDA1 family)
VIEVVGTADRRVFGIETALGIAGLPHRRVAAASAHARAVVLAVDGAEAAGPAGPATVRLGLPAGPVATGPVTLDLDAPAWPAVVQAIARRFGVRALALPRATYATGAVPAGAVLAVLRDAEGRERPAIVESDGGPRALVDLGAALADLLDERYLPDSATPRTLPRPLLALYYRAPEAWRRALQRRTYARLARRLGPTASTYPVDASGWLAAELIVALVRRAVGGLVRLAPWPAPYTAAAVLTHDVEPSRFAYGAGLATLLATIARTGHPATLGLVAGPAARRLGARLSAALDAHEVLCHGLEHRGEAACATLGHARALLEQTLGRRVRGFRSPRLDRSAALLAALDASGFDHDSSFPDVDRENLARFGGGVRLNIPYRPPVTDGGDVRPSRCLELPVSAPDCIQPLFAGDDATGLREAVRRKIAFVRATGGLYTGIVHAGVFGPADAARRAAHLEFVAGELDHPDLWRTTPAAVADWWTARERLVVRAGAGWVEVANEGERAVEGVQVIVEHAEGATTHAVPRIEAGATARIAAAGRAA